MQALWLCSGNKECIFSKIHCGSSFFIHSDRVRDAREQILAITSINTLKLAAHDPKTGEINKKEMKIILKMINKVASFWTVAVLKI